jgi:hypothetical protein
VWLPDQPLLAPGVFGGAQLTGMHPKTSCCLRPNAGGGTLTAQLRRPVRRAAYQNGNTDPVTPVTLLGHQGLSTKTIDTHVLNKGGGASGVRQTTATARPNYKLGAQGGTRGQI